MLLCRRPTTSLRLLLAVAATIALGLNGTHTWANDRDEEMLVLSLLEDEPSDDDPPFSETLTAPGDIVSPTDDEDPTKIELSDEEDILQEEVIPMCTTGRVYDGDLWYTHFDFVYLFNQPLRKRKQFEIALATDNTTVLATENLKLRWRPGMRGTIGRQLGVDNLNRDQSLEFTFWGLFDWVEQTSLSGLGGSATVRNEFLFPVGFLDANTVGAEYEATLNSYEINFRLRKRLKKDRLIMAHDGTWSRQAEPDFLTSYYGGLRYIRYDTAFVMRSVREDAATGYDAVQAVETRNDLFGIQVGLDLIHQDTRWYWGIRNKFGALINAAHQDRRDFVVFEAGGDGEFTQEGDDNQLAFMWELGAFANYQIHPNVAARISYDAMWLHGVALAPSGVDNFGIGLSEDINANENGIFHGLSLGIEMKW